jgi:hypothetical protein
MPRLDFTVSFSNILFSARTYPESEKAHRAQNNWFAFDAGINPAEHVLPTSINLGSTFPALE